MSLTFDTLSQRLEGLELQVGVGDQWPHAENVEHDNETSLVHKLASLQEKVDRIIQKHKELRALPDAIRKYRDGSDTLCSVKNDESSGGSQSLLKNDSSDTHNDREITRAEKQELVIANYPSIIQCYNLLTEFMHMDIPTLCGESVDALSLESVAERKLRCETLARKFHLLIVKSLIILEKFTDMLKHQANVSRNIDRRMRILSSKIVSLERKRHEERRY